jgi:hypothetical protein
VLLRDADLRQRLAAHARKVIEQRFDRRTNFAELKALLLRAAQNQVSEGLETDAPLMLPSNLPQVANVLTTLNADKQ